jgi:phage tail protein X
MASVEMQKAAADLIERARCGDQNATAMIIEIRKAALKGSDKAQVGFDLLKRLVAANPVKPARNLDGSEAQIGEEAYEALHMLAHRGPILALAALVALPDMGGEKGITAAAVVLANGPRVISKRLVSEIGSGIEEHVYRRCFFYGVKACGHDGRKVAREVRGAGDADLFIHAGRCVGLARAIQRVRAPGSSIARFNRAAGWELGEQLNFEGMYSPLLVTVGAEDEGGGGDEAPPPDEGSPSEDPGDSDVLPARSARLALGAGGGRMHMARSGRGGGRGGRGGRR